MKNIIEITHPYIVDFFRILDDVCSRKSKPTQVIRLLFNYAYQRTYHENGAQSVCILLRPHGTESLVTYNITSPSFHTQKNVSTNKLLSVLPRDERYVADRNPVGSDDGDASPRKRTVQYFDFRWMLFEL